MAAALIKTFVKELPKCEHHVHIEGCLSPSLQYKLAARNNITFPSDDPSFASPESLQDRYERFTSLDDFLHYYYIGMNALITREDFRDLMFEYLERAHADGVRHAEIFFDPQCHTTRGIEYAVLVDALYSACRDFEGQHADMTTALIPCFVRHLPAQSAMEHLSLMKEDLTSGKLLAIGLDSSEVGFPHAWWKEVFAEAKQMGITRRTAHGGEEGGPDGIRNAIKELDVGRIDHGVAMGVDPELMREMASTGMLVTVCPVSNFKLQVFSSLDQVPIRAMLDHGVHFSINSDDPAYFGAWTLDCYLATQRTFNLTAWELIKIAEYGIDGSWCGEKRKTELRDLLQQSTAAHVEDELKLEGTQREALRRFWTK